MEGRERGPSSDWDRYAHYTPSNPVIRWLFLDLMYRGYQDLLRRAHFSGPISVLELGAGTGYTTLRLCQALPVEKVTLVDSNPAMLTTARGTLEGLACEKAFLQTDVLELPVEARFDLVHSAGLVEHFETPERKRLLQLHADLTRPGGYCIVYAPTPTRSYQFWRRLAEGMNVWLYTDEVPLPEDLLVREVGEAGLGVLGTNRFWRGF
ncbi:MAG: class I SAM-dependent methyltransferase, partial [Thermoplasmata archaeon]|nr:class I SAM-dependent methyltransferase [Thermoplasmata archaeon]